MMSKIIRKIMRKIMRKMVTMNALKSQNDKNKDKCILHGLQLIGSTVSDQEVGHLSRTNVLCNTKHQFERFYELGW